jgi:hypothetical protein
VESPPRHQVRRDLLVAHQAQRALPGLVRAIVALAAIRLEIRVRARELAGHQEPLELPGSGR